MLEAWWITAILDVVAIKHQKQNILTRKFRRRIFSFLLRCLFWRTIQKNFPHCICIFWSISLIGKWTYLVGKSLCSFFIIINSYWQYTVKNSIGKQAYSKIVLLFLATIISSDIHYIHYLYAYYLHTITYVPLQLGRVPVHSLFRSHLLTESPISMYP